MAKDWQFPGDMIVNRALIEVLIAALGEAGTIDVDALMERFDERFKELMAEEKHVADTAKGVEETEVEAVAR